MNELIEKGRRRTVSISISILLVSIHTIYFYHAVRPGIETEKLIQQIIRFLLTSGLLFMIYEGKNWAKKIAIVLFTFVTVFTINNLFKTSTSIVNKIPFIVMIIVYSFTIYHLTFSKSFEAFQSYQNNSKVSK